MLTVLLWLVAFLCFLLAAVNQTLFSQPPADLIAWVLATLLAGYGPPVPWRREP